MQKPSTYFSQLSFDPKLKRGFFHFFVSRPRIVALIIILLSGWGGYAYTALPRESNPEVKIPVAIVSVAFPGASPGDVEELVTKKVETEVSSLKGVDTVTSTSANSISTTVINFASGENLDNAIRSVRDAMDTVKTKLPDDAKEPVVSEVSFSDQPILTLALTGPYDGETLYNDAEKLKKELEKVPGVREVILSGGDQTEFSVSYIPEKLAAYNLSAGEVNAAIAARNISVPSGNYDAPDFSYPVRSDARFFTAHDLAETPIRAGENGSVLQLKDVANVTERAAPKVTHSRFSLGGEKSQNAVTIDIKKKTGGSILNIVAAAKQTGAKMAPTFGEGVRIETTVDFSKQIGDDFTQLGHDFLITVLLVVGTLFLIVGLKEALIAGLAIPLVFFATFGVMLSTGISLNFLSLFSLILSLGLLVDDAIVVVSATKQYLRSGKFTPEEAILLVLRDFRIVLLTTTLATTFAFLPLLLATGIIGEFIKSIPITVSVTLLSSLVIALLVNNPLAAVLERVRFTKTILFVCIALSLALGFIFLAFVPGIAGYLGAGIGIALAFSLGFLRFSRKGNALLETNAHLVLEEKRNPERIRARLAQTAQHAHDDFAHRLVHGAVGFERVIPIYERILAFLLSSKKRRLSAIAFVVTLFIVAVSFLGFGIVKTEFFPASDSEYVFINITAPSGLKLDRTDAIAQKVEERLRSYPEIKNFSTVVGRAGLSGSRADGSGGGGSNLAGITISLTDKKSRTVPAYDIATKIRTDLSDITDADISVESQAGGPPAGSAFEARISGDDLPTLAKTAEDLKKILEGIPGVVGADVSLKEAPAEYTFALDSDRLALFHLDAAMVGSTLRTAISGTEVSTVLRDNKEYSVTARFDTNALPTLESVQNLQIVNRAGAPVFLKDVARIELRPSVNAVTRYNEQRIVTLSAGAEGKTNPQDILKAFQAKLAEHSVLPEGYAIAYGGQNEENAKSVQSILRAMLVAAILIVTVLVVQFNSFREAALVLVTLPLALIGVFFGLALFSIPLSFPGLIGVLALFGIVVKNAIILVDKINLNRETGIPFTESILDAGKSRLEAILVTSLCTILGILPVTLSDDTWRALGSAVIFGLLFSSFLTLFVIPVLYAMIAKKEERGESI